MIQKNQSAMKLFERSLLPRLPGKKWALLFLIGTLLITGCGKENILWIVPGYDYHVDVLMVKNSQGQWVDVRKTYFAFADDITFTKYHPLGVGGDGVIKVIDDQYTTTQYEGYAYDNGCGCYYSGWETYTVTTKSTQVNEYHFKWDKESQRRISLDFTEADPVLQGQDPNIPSFWEFLDRDYVVSFEGRDEGRLEAKLIMLENESVKMILRR